MTITWVEIIIIIIVIFIIVVIIINNTDNKHGHLLVESECNGGRGRSRLASPGHCVPRCPVTKDGASEGNNSSETHLRGRTQQLT